MSDILAQADIRIGGDRPWDIEVHDPRFYGRVLSGGTLGVGESYMDGLWDTQALDEATFKLLRQIEPRTLFTSVTAKLRLGFFILVARLFNRQNTRRSAIVAKKHYDIGNELYTKMLDPWMQYSCGYWEKGAKDLNEAQEAKLALIAQKLKLTPGMRVLDIGCGWGGLSKYLAEKHGVSVTGITVSEEQAKLAREWVKGLSVDIQVVDYRLLEDEPFDRIVSVGMFEHVGYKNYRTYMKHAARLLKDDGIFLLHTIGRNDSVHTTDPWIDTYIFPNGMLPSPKQVTEAAEGHFVLEDWHNFGTSYDKTLLGWYENFLAAWPELSKDPTYDERFYRMWVYYLLTCAGAFRSRRINLWQLVLTKKGVLGGYQSVR